MPIVEIATAGLALGKLFSDSMANSSRRNALNKYKKSLQDSMYDENERRTRLDDVRDAYNTNIADSMNSSAFGYSNYLNRNTARGLIFSKLLGQRENAALQESSRIDQFNEGVKQRIAAVELDMPIDDPVGSLIEGGVAGLQLGTSIQNFNEERNWNNEFNEMLKRMKKLESAVTKKYPEAPGGTW